MIPLHSIDPPVLAPAQDYSPGDLARDGRPINKPKTGVLHRAVDDDEARRRHYLLMFSQVCEFWGVGRPPLLLSLKGLYTDHLSNVLRVPSNPQAESQRLLFGQITLDTLSEGQLKSARQGAHRPIRSR